MAVSTREQGANRFGVSLVERLPQLSEQVQAFAGLLDQPVPCPFQRGRDLAVGRADGLEVTACRLHRDAEPDSIAASSLRAGPGRSGWTCFGSGWDGLHAPWGARLRRAWIICSTAGVRKPSGVIAHSSMPNRSVSREKA
ncbi:hypothetical protein [Kitasatospora sp. NPDC089509]|uniref:hypothetical protein n=1 Tax=Kitasatospora sp. NPDC089509 TaxID=3364079 RepID=UPI00382386A7